MEISQIFYIVLSAIMTFLSSQVVAFLRSQKAKEKQRDEENQRKYKEIDRIRKANSEGIMLVLRYMLKRYHTEYTIQGKITYTQYQDWMDIYAAYKALGGNSIAEEWNEDVEQLEKCNSTSDMSPFEKMLRKE